MNVSEAYRFVIGAGASHDLGLPTGDQLRDRLIELLRQKDSYRLAHEHLNDAVRRVSERRGGGQYFGPTDLRLGQAPGFTASDSWAPRA